MNLNFSGSNVLYRSGIRLFIPHLTVSALNLPRRSVRERISFFSPLFKVQNSVWSRSHGNLSSRWNSNVKYSDPLIF